MPYIWDFSVLLKKNRPLQGENPIYFFACDLPRCLKQMAKLKMHLYKTQCTITLHHMNAKWILLFFKFCVVVERICTK